MELLLCSAMQPQEKQQLASFGADARRRVAEEVKCNVSAVSLLGNIFALTQKAT